MSTATLTSKGQITIPAQVRVELGVNTGDRIEFVEIGEGQFAIVAATRSVKELDGIFRGRVREPVSIEQMNATIARRGAGGR
ncbi:MAG: AbrB family transcriptional regulator [Acidobacteria bacterium]|nr:MAG: AbrB family transcriptional regulator [Acidobacteriota bacterium]